MSKKDKLALSLVGVSLAAPLVGGGIGALKGAIRNPKSKNQKDIEDLEEENRLLREDVSKIEKAKKEGKAWYDEEMQDWTSDDNSDEAGLKIKKEWIRDNEKLIKDLKSKSSSSLRKQNIKDGWRKGKIIGSAISIPSLIGQVILLLEVNNKRSLFLIKIFL